MLVELGNLIKVIDRVGDSLGTITTQDATQSTTVGEIDQSYAINIPEIYSLAQELIQFQEGIPVISSDTYTLNLFVDAEYKEMLIEIQQKDPQFRFRFTKAI
ncbi:MAG TPA: hypothetical protein HA360_02870 [Nanoarchaeota archaeon]|nr:hypothetical protein [Candidatus Woesearchaeota archaeon]HIH15360.1 hypothetical protein [Nanoarchaeota archaeon]HIH58992.1 hypothetical protein [Nanoarchaeota archaeon]HII13993.1 hypothetical protein [Nanoarchaeota archaeon]HIJ05481.1 hypothetical protein [Nanoarchaeota archaeon]